ncbi:MAG TPA: nuclear transport factor 2 family protein [Nitrososphaeraceae archaeon]|nr:nuclear transport factor 2 family protein [Nitrososphaeraceae archaeon]
MTMPKGWKAEQKTSATNQQKTSTTNQQKTSTTNEQKSSISVDDKIIIQELITKYNLAIDSKNIDEWSNTWTDDGIWTTTFGEAKGKTELKNMANQITEEFASGKRHVSTNIIIEDASTNNMANAKSYLTVIEAQNTPEVVATGVYNDTLKKDGSGKWKFFQRKLDIDLVHDSKK